MANFLKAELLIKMGGIINTGFFIFHVINDWSHIGEPPAIILLTILGFFSIASFFLTKALLTNIYGKIVFVLFCLLYGLRSIRSIQSFVQQSESIDIEGIVIFVGCVLCITTYITAYFLSRKKTIA